MGSETNGTQQQNRIALKLAMSPRRSQQLLILSVFIVASCALAYELIIAALASYLLGDSITQFSTIIGAYLFAMGLGAHLSRYVHDDMLLDRFIEIELLVALFGGISALLLFVLFGFSNAPFRSVLYGLVLFIGTVVGMEIPLVLRILNRYPNEFKDLVSRVLSFDYLGSLAVSLLFPLLLAPMLGLARSALLFGLLNAAVAALTAHVFARQLKNLRSLHLRCSLVSLLLLTLFVFADGISLRAEQRYFSDPIVVHSNSLYQRLVVTRWKDDIRLYLNGNLQFSSRDEARYHEAMVLPAMEQKEVREVLILGGGDGLAAREVLKYPQVERVVLVDLDPSMTRLFSTSEPLTQLNAHSLQHPKMQIINADAAQWLQKSTQDFDLILIDLPDPANFALGKLYSVPMYRMVKQHLKAGGQVVVQATSPYFAPHAYWCVVRTLEKAGFQTSPYHIYVPSFGEWGFVHAMTQGVLRIPQSFQVTTRYLDAENTAQMFYFPPDMRAPDVEANHLNNQILVRYFESDWNNSLHNSL